MYPYFCLRQDETRQNRLRARCIQAKEIPSFARNDKFETE
jgi:hypothetical protein